MQERYLTDSGSEPFENRDETLKVRGGGDAYLVVQNTSLGSGRRPRRGGSAAGARAGPRTIRARPTCTCSTSRRATNVDEALDVANRAGGPVQNVLVADTSGRIGWSLMGQVPVRASYDSTLPHSWREPGGGWTGWRAPHEYPRIVDPASGRLWTANARTIDVDTLARVPRRRWL